MIDYTPKKKPETYEKFSNKYSTRTIKCDKYVSPVQSGYNPRVTEHHPSLGTSGGIAALKPSMQYTGNEMLGLTIIHKSCIQPVFDKQAAKDAASMRR